MIELRPGALKGYLKIQGVGVERLFAEPQIKADKRKLWSWDCDWYIDKWIKSCALMGPFQRAEFEKYQGIR